MCDVRLGVSVCERLRTHAFFFFSTLPGPQILLKYSSFLVCAVQRVRYRHQGQTCYPTAQAEGHQARHYRGGAPPRREGRQELNEFREMGGGGCQSERFWKTARVLLVRFYDEQPF